MVYVAEVGVLGRVVIPAELRRNLLLRPGTKIYIKCEKGMVVIIPAKSAIGRKIHAFRTTNETED